MTIKHTVKLFSTSRTKLNILDQRNDSYVYYEKKETKKTATCEKEKSTTLSRIMTTI